MLHRKVTQIALPPFFTSFTKVFTECRKGWYYQLRDLHDIGKKMIAAILYGIGFNEVDMGIQHYS
jgi:hypothetical protein